MVSCQVEIFHRKIDVLTQAFSFVKTNPALSDAKTGKNFLEDLIDEIDKEINGFKYVTEYNVDKVYKVFLRF